MVAPYDPTKGEAYNSALAWALIQQAWKQVIGPEKQAQEVAAMQHGQAGYDSALMNNLGLQTQFAGRIGAGVVFPKVADDMAATSMKRSGGGSNADEFSAEVEEKSQQLGIPASDLKQQVEEKVERALRGEDADMFVQAGQEQERETLMDKVREIAKDVFGANRRSAGMAPGRSPGGAG